MMELITVNNSNQHYFRCKQWLENKEITQWLTSALRAAKYHKLIHDKLCTDRKNGLYFITAENTAVGLAGFHAVDRIDKRAEIWYLIGSKEIYGHNYATQAVAMLKQNAKNELNLKSVYAFVAAPNKASVRVLEKNSFMYTGMLRQAFCLNDSFVDLLIYDWICQ